MVPWRVSRPKEFAHAELVTEWVQKLRPKASEALLLAARAHHIRRWDIPRSAYPEGREGYLGWRGELHRHHADTAGAILEEVGYDPETIARVQPRQRMKHHRSGLEGFCVARF